MLKTVLMWGPAAHTPLTLDTAACHGDLAAVTGRWDISSLAFGMGEYALAATLVRAGDQWKLASLCVGPEE